MHHVEKFVGDDYNDVIDEVRGFFKREGGAISVVAVSHTVGPDYGGRTQHFYTIIFEYTGEAK